MELIKQAKYQQRPDITKLIRGYKILDTLSGITDLSIIYSEIKPGGIFSEHLDAYNHIFLVIVGELNFLIEGKSVKLNEGVLLKTVSGEKHGYSNDSESIVKLLTLNIFNKT